LRSVAARAILDWSRPDLGERAGVSWMTVQRFENGNLGGVSEQAIAKMRGALESAGVTFLDGEGGPGIRLRDIGSVKKPTRHKI
jgi:transcriptional regulator with XRE-family HTH domain